MLDFAIDIARRAGALLLAGLNSQRRIVSAIRAEFPGHAILAEESGGTVDNARPTWLIDPLDGTNNYAHGFPYFAVSLALWAEQQPLIGVVYDPLRDELFSASA